jgi:hypothetical protein
MGCSALSAQRRPPLTLESGVYYFFLLIFEGRRISAAPLRRPTCVKWATTTKTGPNYDLAVVWPIGKAFSFLLFFFDTTN